MKRSISVLSLVLTVAIVLPACSDQKSGAAKAEGSSDAQGSPQAELCAAVDKLDASLDALEDSESIDEFSENQAVVKANFQEARAAGGEDYAAEFDAFEEALTEFEASLSSLDNEGLISGLLGLAGDAAELAAAGDALDDAIDC